MQAIGLAAGTVHNLQVKQDAHSLANSCGSGCVRICSCSVVTCTAEKCKRAGCQPVTHRPLHSRSAHRARREVYRAHNQLLRSANHDQ